MSRRSRILWSHLGSGRGSDATAAPGRCARPPRKGRGLAAAGVAVALLLPALPALAADAPAEPAAPAIEAPRTLEGYVEQERDFYDFLKKTHPLFTVYEKEGRLVGKYQISNREEEFVEFGGGADYLKEHNRHASVTYRLGQESILDLPNKFVGSKKCGECHPAQYEKWLRSRHNLVVRFPDEVTEAPDLSKNLYGQASVLPDGITADSVYAIIGTPRTKYGFIDPWLVRGTYHIEGGTLRDRTGTLVAGGNQSSRSWAESITPEVAKRIASYVPGFPTKLEEFGDQGSSRWGMTSYGAKNRKSMLFQPATSYCEVCHSFKFDFKSQAELMAALGKPEELRKHTVNKGISCEECHGAGAHLVGARGVSASNCERCHQRFAWNKDEAQKDPRHPFSSYFKSKCPSCGTEGSQAYYTAHSQHGMTCDTCHDPHEVTANDWRDTYTIPGLKKQCQDCHQDQAVFFAKNEIHGQNRCTSCHMPVMMSCENFTTIQFPDAGGFDTQRASHIWKILVDPEAKTLNPPEGKGRDAKDVPWRLAKRDGKPFVDLMWSCGRTSWGDADLAQTGGCHSAARSSLPKDLQFTNQRQIYERVVAWQKPVKEGVAEVKALVARARKSLASARKMKKAEQAQLQLMVNEAEAIVVAVERDGSSGVHAPNYTLEKVKEAKLLAEGATRVLSGQEKLAAK